MAERTRGRSGDAAGSRRKWPRLAGDLLTLALVFALMGAVYLLPPDTSLAEAQRTGTLKVCVPEAYPPLVESDAQRPGFDVSLASEIAQRLGLTLSLNRNPEMGRDFNPRNWRINRAQCELLAGGVVASVTTRSFLETVETGLETGWAIVTRQGQMLGPGLRVGVYPGLGGLDRIALGSFLRQRGLRPVLGQSLEALQAGLDAGDFDAVVAESLSAQQLVRARRDWQIMWMPAGLGRYPLSFGLWKGDLTLKRAVLGAMDDIKRSGVLATLTDTYGVSGIITVAEFPP